MAALMGDDLDDLENLDEDLGRQRRFQGANAGTQKLDDIRGTVSKGKGREEKENSSPDMMGAADKVKAMGINNHEMRGVQDWVTARDDENWTLLPEGVVCINVTHSNLNQKMLELRFDLHQTIGEVKARLHLHHGTPSQSQRLTLRDGGVDIAQLDDDSKMLGFYSVTSGMFIHVTDVDPHSISKGGALENVNLVERYRMDEETYDKRKGTVREWIREQRAKDPDWKPPQMPGAQMANAKTKPCPARRRTPRTLSSGRGARCSPVAGEAASSFVGRSKVKKASGSASSSTTRWARTTGLPVRCGTSRAPRTTAPSRSRRTSNVETFPTSSTTRMTTRCRGPFFNRSFPVLLGLSTLVKAASRPRRPSSAARGGPR